MRWPWARRSVLPKIPPSPYRTIEPKHVEKAEPAVVVEEHDMDTVADSDIEALRLAQSRTGMQRAWDRVTGKFKD